MTTIDAIQNISKKQEVKKLLEAGKEKFLIIHHRTRNGATFVVEKDNPSHVVARIPRRMLLEMDVQMVDTPIQYYKFV